LALVHVGEGKKAHIEKKIPSKKPTRPKTPQKPCGLALYHGLSSST